MQGIIRIGDKTTHGGAVQSGSVTMIFGGIGVARKGDKVSCPVVGHGPTTIVEGNPDYLDNGIPVAFHGHKCGCGCVSIPPKRPITFRWLIAGVIILLIGMGMTLWFWQGDRTGFKFCF